MARNEDVNTAMWEDEDFDDLSDDAALLYIWSFTNERCNMAGLYRCKARSICEGRMTPARREAALNELAEARFLYYVDGWVWVRSRVKNLRTKGAKMAASVIKAVESCPADHPLRAAFLSEYLKNHWISNRLIEADLDTPSIPHLEPIDGFQGQGKGQGQGKKEKGSRGKGKAPKVDPDSLPADLAPALGDVARQVMPTLERVAGACSMKPVELRAVGLALQAFPDRDHIAVASELEHWKLHGNGQARAHKDVVALYRTFLKRADKVAVPRLAGRSDSPGEMSPYDAKTEVFAA